MSTPQDSTAPVPILPSDPAYVADKTNAVRFSERITDWIAALSPSGESVYDTGWVALIPDAGFTPALLGVRREGRRVTLRGAVTRDAGVWPGSSPVLTLPAGFRPAQWHQQGITSPTHATAYGLGVTISSAGVLSVYRIGTAQSPIAYFDGVSFYVD